MPTDVTHFVYFLSYCYICVVYFNLDIHHSGFGMISSFHLVLKCSGIWQFFLAMLQYVPNLFGVLRCSELPSFPSHKHQRQIEASTLKV